MTNYLNCCCVYLDLLLCFCYVISHFFWNCVSYLKSIEQIELSSVSSSQASCNSTESKCISIPPYTGENSLIPNTVVPNSLVTKKFGTKQCGTKQFGTKQFGTKQFGTKQFGTKQFGTKLFSTTLFGTKLFVTKLFGNHNFISIYKIQMLVSDIIIA